MNPKLRGIAGAMAKLNHGLEARAEKLLTRIGDAETRGEATFATAHRQIDEAEAALADVDKFMSDLAGANGGPTLDGSQESSVSPRDEPAKSWAGGREN